MLSKYEAYKKYGKRKVQQMARRGIMLANVLKLGATTREEKQALKDLIEVLEFFEMWDDVATLRWKLGCDCLHMMERIAIELQKYL